MKRLRDFFLGPEQPDPLEPNRKKMLQVILLCIASVSSLNYTLKLLSGGAVLTSDLFGICVLLCLAGLLKAVKPLRPVIILSLIFTYLQLPAQVIAQGTLVTPDILWYTIPTVAGFYFLNISWGIGLTVFSVAQVVSVYWIIQTKWFPITRVLPNKDESFMLIFCSVMGFICFFITIAERAKSQYEQLDRERERELDRSSKFAAIGEMAGTIAHEINNPLSIIAGHADVILVHLKNSIPDPYIEDNTRSIIKTTKRIAKFVNSLLQLSRASDIHQPMVSTPIQEVLDTVTELAAFKLKRYAVDLRVAGANNEALVHSEYLAQVLLNLVANSIYAIQNMDERWIEITVVPDGEHLRIYFIDSGHGIEQEVADKIMESYFTTKAIGEGTGLGLSISKSLVRRMGGELKYEPSAKNTTFVIRLHRQVVGQPSVDEDVKKEVA